MTFNNLPDAAIGILPATGLGNSNFARDWFYKVWIAIKDATALNIAGLIVPEQ